MSRSFLKLYLMVSTTIPIQYINNEYIVEAFPNVAETPTATMFTKWLINLHHNKHYLLVCKSHVLAWR